MSELLADKFYELARAYIALALAQNVAKCYVSEEPADTALRQLLTILNVTAELLEEILQDARPEESAVCSLPTSCSEMLM